MSNLEKAIATARKLAIGGVDCGIAVRSASGDPIFISHWFGSVAHIEEVERDINDNPDSFDSDSECYVFLITMGKYNESVTDDLGQVELPGGWDFTVEPIK